MSTETMIGDGGEHDIDPHTDIEKDFGWITPGGGGGSAPSYTPIFYTPWY